MLILVINLFDFDDLILVEFSGVEVDVMKVDGGNLVVVISCIIENTLLKVVAGTIKSVFVFVVTEVAAAVLLVDRVEDVEELANATHLVVGGEGMEFGKGSFDEARLRT